MRPERQPWIVVSNDDGINAPGIRAAVEALMPLGRVTVLAPATQQSAMGRSLSGRKGEALRSLDFDLDGRGVEAWTCDCSPALLVSHGLRALSRDRRPNLLVSGINHGENLGDNLTLSGTVGAAMEGAAFGLPALAMSLQVEDPLADVPESRPNWAAAGHFTALFARILLSNWMPEDVHLLNVVVPACATSATPWRLTRASRQPYFSMQFDPRHPPTYVGDGDMGVHVSPAGLEPDSDIRAILFDRVVSVTPVSTNLTSRVDFARLGEVLAPPAPNPGAAP